MLRAGWSLANSSNILSYLNGEIAYVLRVPRIIPVYRAALRNSRQFNAEKKAKRQQQRPDCHIDTRNTRTAQLYSGTGGLHPPYAVGCRQRHDVATSMKGSPDRRLSYASGVRRFTLRRCMLTRPTGWLIQVNNDRWGEE